MVERRPLVEGLKVDRTLEEQFVYRDKASAGGGQAAAPGPAVLVPPAPVSRVPLTTRVRADLAQALKRASLERQLQGVQPNSVQDILESALEPWLREHGYLP
jgi:hypothetical protein